MRSLVGISLSHPRYRVGDKAAVSTIYNDSVYDGHTEEPDVRIRWCAVLDNDEVEMLAEEGREIIVPTGVGGKLLRATATVARTRVHDSQELSAETETYVQHPIPVIASVELIRIEDEIIFTDTNDIMIGDQLSIRYQLVDNKISEGPPRIKWFCQGVESTAHNNKLCYTVSEHDLHHSIQVQVTVTSLDDFPGIPMLATSGTVGELKATVNDVLIFGIPREGQQLSLGYEGRGVSILNTLIPDHFIEWSSSHGLRIASGPTFNLLPSEVGSTVSVTVCLPHGVASANGKNRLTSKPTIPIQRSPIFDPEYPIEDVTMHIKDLPQNCNKTDLRWLTKVQEGSWAIAAVGSVFTPTVDDIGKKIRVISDSTKELLLEAKSEVAAHPNRILGQFTVGEHVRMEDCSEVVWQRKLPNENDFRDVSKNDTILLLPEDEGYEFRLVSLAPQRFLFPKITVTSVSTIIAHDDDSPIPTFSIPAEFGVPFCWFVGGQFFEWNLVLQSETFTPSVDHILQNIGVCRPSYLPLDRCLPDFEFGTQRLFCTPKIVSELEDTVMKGICGFACQLNRVGKVIVVLSSSGVKISSMSTEEVIHKLKWSTCQARSNQEGQVTITASSDDLSLGLLYGSSEMFLLVFRLFQALSVDPIVPIAVSHPWKKGLTRPGPKSNPSKILELSTFIKTKQNPRHLIPEVGNPVRNTLLSVIMKNPCSNRIAGSSVISPRVASPVPSNGF
eukprot:TRINITY_DN33704_c0_g1_i1.p1 TRINITY_DN33704_c0_g1~~TRINITY_DN33704_c0_g1_i1.p1  ORF type:complete len:728 (+),score=103.01 TRINITY_DN33704_c0_g1_i1:70-2253(+)